jgi:hypothetical protein
MNTAAGSTIDSYDPGGDAYTGINAFGAVADQNWVTGTSTLTSVDRIQYGCDQNGNVTYEQNLVTTNQSSVFTYDSLNRLISYNRGSITVSGGSATLASNIASGSWSLDAVGAERGSLLESPKPFKRNR